MTASDERPTRDFPGAFTANRPRAGARPWERAEYQRLWLRMERRAWRTLAIVPGEEGMSTYEVASVIMALGVHHGESIGLFDFRDIQIPRVLPVIEAACGRMSQGERILFATRSIRENLATIPLARAADGVVLCVSIGTTSIGFVEETIDQIGRDRFLGSIVVRAPRGLSPVPPATSWRKRLLVA
jgi:hypothetical protein